MRSAARASPSATRSSSTASSAWRCPSPAVAGAATAGVAVSAPAARLSADKARSHVTALRRGAERLSAALLDVADA